MFSLSALCPFRWKLKDWCNLRAPAKLRIGSHCSQLANQRQRGSFKALLIRCPPPLPLAFVLNREVELRKGQGTLYICARGGKASRGSCYYCNFRDWRHFSRQDSQIFCFSFPSPQSWFRSSFIVLASFVWHNPESSSFPDVCSPLHILQINLDLMPQVFQFFHVGRQHYWCFLKSKGNPRPGHSKDMKVHAASLLGTHLALLLPTALFQARKGQMRKTNIVQNHWDFKSDQFQQLNK